MIHTLAGWFQVGGLEPGNRVFLGAPSFTTGDAAIRRSRRSMIAARSRGPCGTFSTEASFTATLIGSRPLLDANTVAGQIPALIFPHHHKQRWTSVPLGRSASLLVLLRISELSRLAGAARALHGIGEPYMGQRGVAGRTEFERSRMLFLIGVGPDQLGRLINLKVIGPNPIPGLNLPFDKFLSLDDGQTKYRGFASSGSGPRTRAGDRSQLRSYGARFGLSAWTP